MKTPLLTLLSLLLCVGVMQGCKSDPISVEQSSNGQIQIEFLFEKDGCKIYRFLDGTQRVYYTDCTGKTHYQEYHSNGKGGGYYEDHDTTTN